MKQHRNAVPGLFWVITQDCKGEAPIDVEEVDEVLVGFERVFHDHQDVHPATSDSLVFQGCKENFDPMGLTVEGIVWECFDPGLVEFGPFQCSVVNDAVICEYWG